MVARPIYYLGKMLVLLEAWGAGGLEEGIEGTKFQLKEQPNSVVFLGHGKAVEARV